MSRTVQGLSRLPILLLSQISLQHCDVRLRPNHVAQRYPKKTRHHGICNSVNHQQLLADLDFVVAQYSEQDSTTS